VRIQTLRTEADALEEQLKTSVKKLAELRHELFETPATTFPEDSRAVPFDELLQYATNISRYTVPPTYRERVPTVDKDKEEDEGASSGAPTNGVNTPAHAIEAAEPPKDGADGEKEAKNADGVPEITAEEEEWLQKLKASNLAWYPWPSNDKIRAGILSSLQYWRAKGKDLDDFNIPAHLEALRLMSLGDQEGSGSASPSQAAQQHRDWVQLRHRPQGVFAGFDDMDEE
jgi:hypothetical protein